MSLLHRQYPIKLSIREKLKMIKLGQIFSTEIVTGICDGCRRNTILVGINGEFFRCTNCGEDLEQKVNGVIKYIKADRNTKFEGPHVKE